MKHDKRNDLREVRINNYNNNRRLDEKEVWQEVKQYYRDIDKFDKDKKAKAQAIMDKLVAYYNAASGAKGEEMRKRAEAIQKSLDEGQVLNRKVLQDLEERALKVDN